MSTEAVVLLAVVGARFVVPLFIPRFPLPAIVASLVLDGVDQTIFQALGQDPPGYQGYDKAMDVYYLAVAYLSTLRNWVSPCARSVASFLYFYRLVGVVAFELASWRPLLLVFPNTFEYFFIAYEVIRLRRDPARMSLRFWISMAAGIWILVKLPQEWWIHIAQLDVTESLAADPWLGAVAVAVLLGLLAVFWWLVRPRLPVPDWTWRLSADELPAHLRSWRGRADWSVEHGRVWSRSTAEKVALVGLIGVVFAQVLPDVRSTNTQLFIGLGVFVVLNAAISLELARRRRGTDSMLWGFLIRLALNIGLVFLADALLARESGQLNVFGALFFISMLSLLTLLDDRFRPMSEYRDAAQPAIQTEVA